MNTVNATTELLRRSNWVVKKLEDSCLKFSCFQYAAMLAGIPRANETVFTDENVLSILRENHFAPVSKAQDGDLAIFFTDEGPQHMGFVDQGKILSKPGIKNEFAYYHAVGETAAMYGDQVCYYRKKDS